MAEAPSVMQRRPAAQSAPAAAADIIEQEKLGTGLNDYLRMLVTRLARAHPCGSISRSTSGARL